MRCCFWMSFFITERSGGSSCMPSSSCRITSIFFSRPHRMFRLKRQCSSSREVFRSASRASWGSGNGASTRYKLRAWRNLESIRDISSRTLFVRGYRLGPRSTLTLRRIGPREWTLGRGISCTRETRPGAEAHDSVGALFMGLKAHAPSGVLVRPGRGEAYWPEGWGLALAQAGGTSSMMGLRSGQ